MKHRIDELFKNKNTEEILIVIDYCNETNLFSLKNKNNEILTIKELPLEPKHRKHKRVGEIFETTKSGKIKIIEYFNATNSTIKFLSDNTIIFNMQYNNIKIGTLINPNDKTLCNIGYIGQGIYNTRTHFKIYNVWNKMIQRCYCEKTQLKHPTYIDCSVYEKWYNFQVFAEWFENNYIEGYHLDKDILVKGNKIYGPDTCCFVPQEINGLFIKANINKSILPVGVTHVSENSYRVRLNKGKIRIDLGCFPTSLLAFEKYKIEKEKYIKEVTELNKHKIPEKVYLILINYKVEITD